MSCDRTREAEFHKEDGNRLYHQGYYDQAVRCYSYAIQCDPTNHHYYTNRSMALARCGAYREALRDAETAIRIDPKSKGYLRAGQALMHLDQYIPALQALKKALANTGDVTEHQEIEVMIAKCESKLATASKAFAQQEVDVLPTAKQQTPPPAPATTTTNQKPPKPSRKIAPKKEEPPVDIAQNLVEVSESLQGLMPLRTGLVKLTDIHRSLVGIQKCQQKIDLPNLCTDSLAKAFAKVKETQATLSTASGSNDGGAFRAAVQARDEAVEALSDLVEHAVVALNDAEAAEEYKSHDENAFDLLASPESLQSLADQVEKTLRNIPDKYRSAVAKTNAAIKALRSAVEYEVKLAEELGVAQGTANVLEAMNTIKGKASAETNATLKAQSAERLANVKAVKDSISLYTDFLTKFAESSVEARRVHVEKEELEARRLALERRRIQLQGDLEWAEVTGNSDKIEGGEKALENLKEQITNVRKKLEEINQTSKHLVEDLRPELKWKGTSVKRPREVTAQPQPQGTQQPLIFPFSPEGTSQPQQGQRQQQQPLCLEENDLISQLLAALSQPRQNVFF